MIERSGNSEPLVSVIVPIYNVAKYLSQCIESIVNQTYSNLEILLIDDGSTDGSESVCSQFVHNDGRVRHIRIPNGGVSHARNVGLDNTTGDWVMFVDGDDYLDTGIVSACMCGGGGI